MSDRPIADELQPFSLSSNRLKRGDYLLHVFVEEGRNFLPVDADDTVDPVVFCNAFGKSKGTSVKKDIGSVSAVYWGEHVFIDIKNADNDVIMTEKLSIEVKDHRTLLKDNMVGTYVMDLASIYDSPEHTIKHQWLALFNPEWDKYDKVTGYIKVSVSLLHEDDKPIDLTVKDPNIIGEENLKIPPQLQPELTQLVVTLLDGQYLVKMDTHGTIDAYIEVQYGNNKQRSSTQKAREPTMSVEWYEKLYIPIIKPSISSKITLTLFDWDTVGSDEHAGAIEFDLKDVIDGKYRELFWANLYGGPENTSNSTAVLMNKVPDLASTWHGRILISLEIVDVDKPTTKMTKIHNQEYKDMIEEQFHIETDYEIRCQIYQAVALPQDDKEFSIKVSWMNISLQTQTIKAVNGTIRWMKNLDRRVTGLPVGGELDIPDVFIYLVRSGKNISYIRLPIEEIGSLEAEPEWLKFNVDWAVGQIKNEFEAGFVQLRLYIGQFIDGSNRKHGNWDRDPENLPPADSNGSADPYVKFYCNGSKNQTKPGDKMCTLNPQYYEMVPLQIEISRVELAPPIIISVWDYDTFSSDDLMGVCIVDLAKASFDQLAPIPEWIPVGMNEETSAGEILISFNLYPVLELPQRSLVQVINRPPTMDVNIEINILGLRGLKPALGWLPVNKAFIKFDLNSLCMPGEQSKGTKIQTQPRQSGRDPNLNTSVSFVCKIPINPLYCPALSVTFIQCSVHDYLLGGLSQPVIGTFSINIGDILFEAKKVKKRSKSVDFDQPQGMKKLPRITVQPAHMSDDDSEENDEVGPLFPSINAQQPNLRSSSYLSISEARVGKMFLKPQFETNVRGKLVECNPPDPELYMEVGYNRHPGDNMKHYRYYIQEELENTDYVEKSPFHFFDIRRGQNRGLSSPFNKGNVIDNSGQKSNIINVGKFKGMIRIIPEQKLEERQAKVEEIRIRREEAMRRYNELVEAGEQDLQSLIEVIEQVDDDPDEDFDDIAKKLVQSTEVCVRVYILDAFDVESQDVGKFSDPYVKIKLGRQVVKDRDNFKYNTATPQFFKHYDLSATLPGASLLKVQLWDHDGIFPDDKIGETIIDLEDRFFSNKWKRIPEKPIETRKIYLKTSRRPQGFVRMWLELHPSSNIPEPLNIKPKPPAKFQVRIIVWRCKNVANQAWEGVSDLYVRAMVNNLPAQETDTHYRAQGGVASWNWRMLFDIELPSERNLMTIQLWDKDFFSPNDYVGEATLSFEQEAEEAWKEDMRVKKMGTAEDLKDRVLRRKTEKFWVDLEKKDNDGEVQETGKLLISLELVPDKQAKLRPVGPGRKEPNVDPKLDPPPGRFKWTWNPIKLAGRMCGPELKYKACLTFCLICICVLLIATFPMFLSEIVTNALFG